MLRRALKLGLALYLAIGIAGLAPALSEALAGDCCEDCADPGCPEESGRECPPRCSDCLCRHWVAPLVIAAPPVRLESAAVQDAAYAIADLSHESPILRGVFRPPRRAA